MSWIRTCRLNGVNPFDDLPAIATHAQTVKLLPQARLPWDDPEAEAANTRVRRRLASLRGAVHTLLLLRNTVVEVAF